MEIKTNNLSQLIKNNVGYDEWIENIKSNLLNLEDELEILEISQIQNSSFGLIFKAVSKLYGNIILKFIPPYINRYENEKKPYLRNQESLKTNIENNQNEANRLESLKRIARFLLIMKIIRTTTIKF